MLHPQKQGLAAGGRPNGTIPRFRSQKLKSSIASLQTAAVIPPRYLRRISKDHRDKMSRRRPSNAERFLHKSGFFLPVTPPIRPVAKGTTLGLGRLSFRFLPESARSEKTTKKARPLIGRAFRKQSRSSAGTAKMLFRHLRQDTFLPGGFFLNAVFFANRTQNNH